MEQWRPGRGRCVEPEVTDERKLPDALCGEARRLQPSVMSSGLRRSSRIEPPAPEPSDVQRSTATGRCAPSPACTIRRSPRGGPQSRMLVPTSMRLPRGRAGDGRPRGVRPAWFAPRDAAGEALPGVAVREGRPARVLHRRRPARRCTGCPPASPSNTTGTTTCLPSHSIGRSFLCPCRPALRQPGRIGAPAGDHRSVRRRRCRRRQGSELTWMGSGGGGGFAAPASGPPDPFRLVPADAALVPAIPESNATTARLTKNSNRRLDLNRRVLQRSNMSRLPFLVNECTSLPGRSRVPTARSRTATDWSGKPSPNSSNCSNFSNRSNFGVRACQPNGDIVPASTQATNGSQLLSDPRARNVCGVRPVDCPRPDSSGVEQPAATTGRCRPRAPW